MASAISKEDRTVPATDGGTWVDPRDGSALTPQTGTLAADLGSDSLARRFGTEDETYANTQGLRIFDGHYAVGAGLVEVANPGRDTLARIVAGDPAIYRGVRLDDVADFLQSPAIAAAATITVEWWGRVRPHLARIPASATGHILLAFGSAWSATGYDYYIAADKDDGALKAVVDRFDAGAPTTISSTIDAVSGGSLIYAALTISGTTATLYGMVAGGTLAQLGQATVASLGAGTTDYLWSGKRLDAADFFGLDVYGIRLWHGVALSLAQLTRIAGKRCYVSDRDDAYLKLEYIFQASDWGTTTATDTGYQGNDGTITSATVNVTTPNDLVPAVDSGWVGIRGPWDSRPCVKSYGSNTLGGQTANTASTTPVVSGGGLFYLPQLPEIDAIFVAFGTDPNSTAREYVIRYAAGGIAMRVSRHGGSTASTTAIAIEPGPLFMYWEINPYTSIATLYVNGTTQTVGSINAYSSQTNYRLFVGRHSSATYWYPNMLIGPVFQAAAAVGVAKAKQWLAEGVPYAANEDVRFYFKNNEATGLTSTDYGTEELNITWSANVTWGRMRYPASILGTATPGGRQSERVARLCAVANADASATGLWFGVHDPQNATGWLSIGRARAFEMERFAVGTTTGFMDPSYTPWQPTGEPGQFSAQIYVSGTERSTLLGLVRRGAPVLVTLNGTENARQRIDETKYGKLSLGGDAANLYLAPKAQATDESTGSSVRLILTEIPT